ncbi:Uncharacterised protein [Streptococcus pneumoniae]|nr:Uncharacterised protein [Streptococcus pneumoniae]
MVFRLGVNNWGFKEIENKKPSKNSIAGENEIILNENQRANSRMQAAQNTVLRLQIRLTKSAQNIGFEVV